MSYINCKALPEESLLFRVATDADVPDMTACRLRDSEAGPADSRMASYFRCEHHPQCALPPRTGYVALASGTVIGYIAGHLTTRHGCAGEVQYLFVVPESRRRGIATRLVRLMANWFLHHSAVKVCVCLDTRSPSARPFYEKLGAVALSPKRPYWLTWENMGILAE